MRVETGAGTPHGCGKQTKSGTIARQCSQEFRLEGDVHLVELMLTLILQDENCKRAVDVSFLPWSTSVR
jgi:hypothetical protein